MVEAPRIYVAGHRGMVGSAIVRALKAQGHADIVTRTRAELDLTDQASWITPTGAHSPVRRDRRKPRKYEPLRNGDLEIECVHPRVAGALAESVAWGGARGQQDC